MEDGNLRTAIKQRVWGKETRGIATCLPLSLICVALVTVFVPPDMQSASWQMQLLDGILGGLVVLAAMTILSAVDYRRRLTVLRELTQTTVKETNQTKLVAKIPEAWLASTGIILIAVGVMLPDHRCLLAAMMLSLFAISLYLYRRYVMAEDSEMAIVRRLRE
jgi:uncharacterized membrane protein YozB (DUF420 family)